MLIVVELSACAVLSLISISWIVLEVLGYAKSLEYRSKEQPVRGPELQ